MPDLSNFKSYLVKLGFDVDDAELAKFRQGLKIAEDAAGFSGSSIALSFAGAGAAVIGTLTSISGATIGLMDHVAQQDLGFQRLGRQMFMSADAARQMKTATDALGLSLDEIVMGPPETRERFRELLEVQKRIDAQGGSSETDFRKIRDIGFEFTLLQVEAAGFVRTLTSDLSKALTGDENGFLSQLESLNEWFVTNIPSISQTITSELVPVLQDTKAIWIDIGGAAKDVLVPTMKLFGYLANDAEMKTGELNLRNILEAFKDVADVVRDIAKGAHIVMDVLTFQKHLSGWNDPAREQSTIRPGAFTHMNADGSTTAFDGTRRASGVPLGLAMSVIASESNFNTEAISNKGAMGLMQLMPDTAAQLGVDDPFDAKKNIGGGTRYLSSLFNKYHDWRSALEAYNWGPGNFDKSHGRVPESVSRYADDILGRVDVGGIKVDINQPGATPEEVYNAVIKAVDEKLGKQRQRDMLHRAGPQG